MTGDAIFPEIKIIKCHQAHDDCAGGGVERLGNSAAGESAASEKAVRPVP